ncbi:MAG: 16S rRNA processing protein RimM [Deltaproteobacteria bacterium]|nr:16S rRNA processing protein RimM [Deltaproteobacteria bacterium]
MDKEKFLLIGKIVGTHGLKGDLKVYSYSETLRVFDTGHSIYIWTAAGQEQVHVIESAKPHKKVVLLSLKGISTISSAESLLGSDLFMEKENLPELEEGAYYWFDIIGLSVFLKDNTFIGNVTSVIPTGSNDVYVVKNPDKNNNKEILVPAIESVVLEIDLKNERMSVDLPEGL